MIKTTRTNLATLVSSLFKALQRITPKVGIHNGEFHLDDVMFVAMVEMVCGAKCVLVRTRDEKILEDCDIVGDVGGVYDPERAMFDHHQMEGAPLPRANGVPYSAAGLLWKEIGMYLSSYDPRVFQLVDERLIQPIDLHDNGKAEKAFLDSEYKIEEVSLTKIVSSLNSTWSERENLTSTTIEEYTAANFYMAVKIAATVLDRAIETAYAEVAAGPQLAKCVERGDKVILFPGEFNWTGADSPIWASSAKYVVYPAADGDWYAQAVPPDFENPYKQRKPFPAEWLGLRDKELAEVSGVKDAVFCHKFAFLCVAHSKGGAIMMAKRALKLKAP